MDSNRSGILVLAGCVGVFLVLIVVLGSLGNNRIDAGPIGTKALAPWLDANGIPAAAAQRRATLAEQDVALRILPLYDMDPTRDSPAPSDRAERRSQTSQRDISSHNLMEKISYVPSLVMLPKWRTGVLELDLLDEQLLISTDDYPYLLGQMGISTLKIMRPDVKFLQTDNGITLYRPQLFTRASMRGNCRAHLSLAQGVLMARCEQESGVPLTVVSDPDLLNNHGLSLGQNAAVATDLIADLMGAHPGLAYVDTSPDILLAVDPTAQRPIRPRTAEEISRFFQYPFSLIWIGAGISFLIMVWRGLVRFGPPARIDQGHIAASKQASIAAKGHLMRLTGDDRSLLIAFVTEKMQVLARDTMGKHAQIDHDRLMARLLAVAPRSAPQLQLLLADLDGLPIDTPSAALVRLADRFEQSYRSILDELGHVSRRR